MIKCDRKDVMVERSAVGSMFYHDGLCQTYNVLISSGRDKNSGGSMRCLPII